MARDRAIEAVRLETIVERQRLAAAHGGGYGEVEPDGWRLFKPRIGPAPKPAAADADRYRANRRTLRAARRAAGLCTECGAPAPGRRLCVVCRDAEKTARADRTRRAIASGTCIVSACPDPAAPGRRKCERHLQAARDRERAKRRAAASAPEPPPA